MSRPSRWGNPWRIGDEFSIEHAGALVVYRIDRAMAIQNYKSYAAARALADPTWLDPLREAEGLACYCSLSEPCHADVLATMLKWDFAR